MKFSGSRVVFVCLLLSGWMMTGCLPSGTGPVEEEKEPHFLEGKSRVTSMDYRGAIESYERALEANPRSSAAHFELGWLYDQKDHDPAAAIYHYACYLKLHSEGTRADRARACITACKQELVKSVSLAPVTQNLQKEIEQLIDENKRLKEELERWRAGASGVKVDGQSAPQIRPDGESASVPVISRVASPSRVSSTEPARSAEPPAHATANLRSHTVKTGETPAAIARKYGVKVDVLMAANPKVDARHLKIGQSLVIPTP